MRQASKAFFSEEKKQKTFDFAVARSRTNTRQGAKVFWFFLSRKNRLLALLFLSAAAPITISPEQQRTIGLQTAQATQRQITEPVHVPGTVGFDEGHVAILRPLAPGRIRRLLAQPGDSVRPGQMLAELDVPSLVTAQDDLAGARASLREAQAGVAVAEDAWRRGVLLARDGSLARAEAERRRLLLTQAQAQVQAARARASALQLGVSRMGPVAAPGTASLASPIAGVVVSVGVTPGESVDSATVALTVADLSVVLVTAQVPEAGAAMVAVGDPAQVRLVSGGDRVWTGRVVTLGAMLDPHSRTLPARIVLANADGALRAGMFADVTLTSDRQRRGTVIPAEAVQSIDDRHVAFVRVSEAAFQPRDLELGVERPDWVEVRSGLKPGDTVATKGSFALKSVLQQNLLGGN